MPIAMHPLIGHDLPYRPMCGNWHELAEIAAERHCHEQRCEATGATPSLLQLIKNSFINNTHYQRDVSLVYRVNTSSYRHPPDLSLRPSTR